MGLDVYLYKKMPDWDKWHALEEEADELGDKIWADEVEKLGKKTGEELTEEESNKIHDMCKVEFRKLGLNEWGSADERKELEIEFPSKKYPEHLFKVGYFRSSYNESGFNHVTRNLLGGKDLYWIFEPGNEDYYFHPNWKKARERCIEFIKEFKEEVDKFPYGCFDINYYDDDNGIHNEHEALQLFKKFLNDNLKKGFRSFSSMNGYYSLDEPIEVNAIITGIGYMKRPTTYVIYKKDYSSYLSSIEIVLETIDYVLSQPNPEDYIFHWSG